MPQLKAGSRRPEPVRKFPWLGLAAVVLVICAVAYYFVTRPAPTPPADLSTTPTASAPITPKHIYSETADPKADIAAALAQAKSEHKRVLIDFGGDWCGDCQVLDIYLHQPPNDRLLQNNFVLVHVWVGHIDTHLDVPEKYGVLIHKGVPELAVLSPDGQVLYAQRGEFEDMSQMEPSSVTEFLDKWKG
jgi:thiol:disulfide interchange protein